MTGNSLALYADDLLLYVTDPLSLLSGILATLDIFSSFSGYKLNLQKSERYPINALGLQLQQADLPFITRSGFNYLGINVTRTFSGLLSANFTLLIAKVKSDLHSWNQSLIGKINVVKMNILPNVFICSKQSPYFFFNTFLIL